MPVKKKTAKKVGTGKKVGKTRRNKATPTAQDRKRKPGQRARSGY